MSKTVASITADIAAEPPLKPSSQSLYIGIDVAKLAHVAGFVSTSLLATHSRHEKCPSLVFANDRAGFEKLYSVMTGYAPAEECFVLLEATAHYGSALEQFLQERGITLYKIHVRARPETHKKTDKHDALSLANLAYNMIEKGIQFDARARQVRLVTPPTGVSLKLKGLIQRHYEISIETTRAKNKLTAICDEVFPEFTQVYTNPNGPGALRLREKFPTPEQIAVASAADLYATRTRNRPSNAEFVQLQELARQTIGTKNEDRLFSLITEQGQLIREFRLLETHQTELDEKIEHLVVESREGKILTSISGIGVHCAAVLISQIGSIANFESAAKLRSFLGWIPEEQQTGITLDRRAMATNGSRVGKQAIFLAVMSAIRYDSPWKTLYDRLVPRICSFDERTQKWKGKMKVIGRIAGQLIGVVYTLLKQDYDLLASIPAGVEPPKPSLYDEARHLRALTRALSKGSQSRGEHETRENRRMTVSASFKRFNLSSGEALILNTEQWTLVLLANGEICKQVSFSSREVCLVEQLLEAWPGVCLNEALLAAYGAMPIDQARDLVLSAREHDTLEDLMQHPTITIWRCREKLVEAFSLDIEKSQAGFQLKSLSPVVS